MSLAAELFYLVTATLLIGNTLVRILVSLVFFFTEYSTTFKDEVIQLNNEITQLHNLTLYVSLKTMFMLSATNTSKHKKEKEERKE